MLRCKIDYEHDHQGPGVEFVRGGPHVARMKPHQDDLNAAARELNMIAMPLRKLRAPVERNRNATDFEASAIGQAQHRCAR